MDSDEIPHPLQTSVEAALRPAVKVAQALACTFEAELEDVMKQRCAQVFVAFLSHAPDTDPHQQESPKGSPQTLASLNLYTDPIRAQSTTNLASLRL